MKEEFQYMKYLGLCAMMLELKSANCLNLSRCLKSLLSTPSIGGSRIWVVVPTTADFKVPSSGNNINGNHQLRDIEDNDDEYNEVR